MDKISQERRSLNMARIRSSGTKPEIAVRQVVYGLGYRYRLHSRKLPGRPDLVISSQKKVVDVRGCFWHQHKQCGEGRVPKSRVGYWRQKLSGNQKRDRENSGKLRKMGWKVLVIWECEVSNRTKLERRIKGFLGT